MATNMLDAAMTGGGPPGSMDSAFGPGNAPGPPHASHAHRGKRQKHKRSKRSRHGRRAKR